MTQLKMSWSIFRLREAQEVQSTQQQACVTDMASKWMIVIFLRKRQKALVDFNSLTMNVLTRWMDRAPDVRPVPATLSLTMTKLRVLVFAFEKWRPQNRALEAEDATAPLDLTRAHAQLTPAQRRRTPAPALLTRAQGGLTRGRIGGEVDADFPTLGISCPIEPATAGLRAKD